jgi:hypothetical protein
MDLKKAREETRTNLFLLLCVDNHARSKAESTDKLFLTQECFMDIPAFLSLLNWIFKKTGKSVRRLSMLCYPKAMQPFSWE